MAYYSTKTYGYNNELQGCLRHLNSTLHDQFLHGYSLTFSVDFTCDKLDANGVVIDFNTLKTFNKWLENNFAYKVILLESDPQLKTFKLLEGRGLAQIKTVPIVSVEHFAYMAYKEISKTTINVTGDRCSVISVTCNEHNGESKTYKP